MIAWMRESEAERPWATWVLLVVTLLAQLGAGGSPDLQARLALVPADPRLSALLGHLFLHSGWLHLLGTLFFLAATGPWLEAQLGRRLFVASYAAAGLAGAALFVSLHPESDAPWLGASAAVAGALGLLAAAARGARVELLGVLAGRAGSLFAPGWALAALWFGGELAGLVGGAGGAVAVDAAGFGFGVALAFAFEKTGAIERAEPQPSARPLARAPRSSARTPLAIPQDPAQLEALLSEATDPAHARAYLAHGEAEGRLDSARAVVAQRLAEALEWRRREPAMALWCALLATGPPPRSGTDELLQLASWLRGAGHGAEATTALHAALSSADASALAKIARAARRSDPVICYRAAERALEDESLGGSDRKTLEGLCSEAEREVATRGIILVPGAAGALPASRVAASAAPPRAVEAAPLREPPAAPRALAFGEAIELTAEPAPAPVALPDPERSGEAAFFDAFHAALHEGAADEAKREAPPLRSLRVREATPRALEDDTLVLEVAGRGALRLRLTRVHAVALAAVRGISERAGDKPVLLVDLCLSAEAEPELQVLRLRSDRFDPRRLAAASSPLEALRAFVSALAAAAHAPLLPADDAAGEAPLRVYRDLATYQREVLGAA
jgi:membrane associated rhomboid family serine protease